MSTRKKIPAAVRAQLLLRGRGGCFAHRLSWYQRVELNEAASKKSLPIDVHHVKFVSAGGDDSIENLVPLCPLCHRVIHESGRLGQVEASPENIRNAWDTWVSFSSHVPLVQSIGSTSGALEIKVDLRTYFLEPTFLVGGDTTYADARGRILEATVGTLARVDPQFPFPAPDIGRVTSWEMSSDAKVTESWNITSAYDAFSGLTGPITLRAPAFIVANRQWFPVLEGNDEQRTM